MSRKTPRRRSPRPTPGPVRPISSNPGTASIALKAPSAPADPHFLSGISSGLYDDFLNLIATTVDDREEILVQRRESRLLADLKLGDRVAFHDDDPTTALRGKSGEVVGIDLEQRLIEICFGRQRVGPYTGKHLVCSPLEATKLPGQHPSLHQHSSASHDSIAQASASAAGLSRLFTRITRREGG
jgi:hypothetical protein